MSIIIIIIIRKEQGSMEVFGRDCCIRGYHVYKKIWREAIGEELEWDRERKTCAIATQYVKRSGVIIGHFPQKLSRVCSLFLRCGGVISCTVTGGRRYSGDLPQGGLEIPCFLLFKHKPKEVQNLKKIPCKAG